MSLTGPRGRCNRLPLSSSLRQPQRGLHTPRSIALCPRTDWPGRGIAISPRPLTFGRRAEPNLNEMDQGEYGLMADNDDTPPQSRAQTATSQAMVHAALAQDTSVDSNSAGGSEWAAPNENGVDAGNFKLWLQEKYADELNEDIEEATGDCDPLGDACFRRGCID